MSLDYIRAAYGVPADLYRRVRYAGDGQPLEGTILGADQASLSVQLDGRRERVKMHPTWEVEYLREFRRPWWADRKPLWPIQFGRALAGRESADALPSADRRLLVARLHELGMTDSELAAWTRMSRYSTARIRSELGLPANLVGVGV
ncbi:MULTISPECIES: hypothetical protein [unclassified Nocardia]|uniref:hypothetical protein n=1 Tax=unclassified Nocardia TaxID=2637762 RepID=UPI00278BCB92|nr:MULTISPECIES: hypothetical protein [unclassified Nocardia]